VSLIALCQLGLVVAPAMLDVPITVILFGVMASLAIDFRREFGRWLVIQAYRSQVCSRQHRR
jgi:hypothetical protein